jgi:hypothetical protein
VVAALEEMEFLRQAQELLELQILVVAVVVAVLLVPLPLLLAQAVQA